MVKLREDLLLILFNSNCLGGGGGRGLAYERGVDARHVTLGV